MSWEVWGTPPDPGPVEEPQAGFMAPQLGSHQEWCCAKGCGPCGVKTVDFAWRTITNLHSGHVQRDTYPIDVSSCCSAELMLWDEEKQDFIDFKMLDRPLPANQN